MTHTHPFGKNEHVFAFSADDQVETNIEPLKKMLLHSKVKNRKIVAFSVIGGYRQGKSFFLDYCLRFLYANCPSINNINNPCSNRKDWIGHENDPLVGFSWRAGSDRDTTGINIWNDVFLHTIERTGEKIAILVIDTQGLFDSDTSTINNSRIFALGTLLSSVQIFNLPGLIHENMLQYLQFATEFAKFAMSSEDKRGTKPFQTLMFLIRDWRDEKKHDYGIEGGKDYLNNYLKIKSSKNEDLKNVRESVTESFERIVCGLLPEPGSIVTKNRKNAIPYNGCWAGMDEEFKDELIKIIEYIFKSENLAVKKINGDKINGKQFFSYVEDYFKHFQSDHLPEAKSVFKSTLETQLNTVVNKCIEHYKELLYSIRNAPTTADQTPEIHKECKQLALKMFENERKMGNDKHHNEFKKILEERIELFYNEWKNITEKNIKMLQSEKEKTRKAIEEKEILLKEQIKIEREAKERLEKLNLEHNRKIEMEIERNEQNMKKMREELEAKGRKDVEEIIKRMMEKSDENIKRIIDQFQEERQALEERLQAEQDRLAEMKAEKEARKGPVQKFLGKAGKKVGEAVDTVVDGVTEAAKGIREKLDCNIM